MSFFDQRDHLGDMVGGAGLDVGWQSIERGHVIVKHPSRPRGERADRLRVGHGGGVDLVVDVGDVARVGDTPKLVPEQAVEQVEDHDRARVADMGAVVDRGAADVEAHMAGIDRHERLLAAALAVIDGETHGIHAGNSL